ERRQGIRKAVLEQISKAGYELEITFECGEAAALSWSVENIEKIMRRCVGAVALAFPRWSIPGKEPSVSLASEYIQYESAVANVLKIPLLVIAERGLAERGVIWTGAGQPILFLPPDANDTWIGSPTFQERFKVWLDKLANRRDVFLGYCSKNKST